jgi:hypothetical protein
MLERPVRPERTAWRDQGLSLRHRTWGYDVPAVDIDFLMCEYDSNTPKACVEYKAMYGQIIQSDTSALKAITSLCDASRIPFFLVAYDPKEFWVSIKAMNAFARKYVPFPRYMSEARYVTLLYELRGRDVPSTVLSRCNHRVKKGNPS